MWCCRRLLKVRWVDRVSNEEVLDTAAEERGMQKNIVEQRNDLIGLRKLQEQ